MFGLFVFWLVVVCILFPLLPKSRRDSRLRKFLDPYSHRGERIPVFQLLLPMSQSVLLLRVETLTIWRSSPSLMNAPAV
jgi:hypothetical protein